MSLQDAARSASIAANQATEAVNIIQRRGVRTDEDRYQENLALAVANLSIAVRQLVESTK
jgi:hypothetical protein